MRRVLLAGGLVILVVLGLIAGFVLLKPHAPEVTSSTARDRARLEDPRLTYTGPFTNVRPDVAYVGDEACADCHRSLVQSFRQHRKGQNFQPAAHQTRPPPVDQAHHNPFETFGARFLVERQGEKVRHRRISLARNEAGQPIYDTAMDVAIAVGSWTNGFSFLSERDGYVFQTPISWFSQKEIWDISPGFGPELFPGRPAPEGCLFCHANRLVRPLEGYQNRYETPVFGGPMVSCERCHGPGQLHIAAHPAGVQAEAAGRVDHTIVNPRRLAPAEREAVCEQCHMVGVQRVAQRGRKFSDFRPGLPLQDFLEVFLAPSTASLSGKAVTHVEFLRRSRCFVASDGKLGCLSCHDSHVYRPPEERRAYYRAACRKCHDPAQGQRDCSLPLAQRQRTTPQDSCTECHMPPYTIRRIPHAATTDHSIPRRPAVKEAGTSNRPGGPGGELPLVPFYHPNVNLQNPDIARNLGIALSWEMAAGHLAPKDWGQPVVHWLEQAIAHDPGDLDAWQAKASALNELRATTESLAALEILLAKAPRTELALVLAARCARRLGQGKMAQDYWRRAIAMNPWMAWYAREFAEVSALQGDWPEALTQSEASLRLDPANVESRVLHIKALVMTGSKEKARTEFLDLKALHPPQLELEAWLAREGR